MSRTRQLAPLAGHQPEVARVLLEELRALKEAAGYDLRTLERKTHSSRSSWGRWLSGETWIPKDATGALAELCGGDRHRLEILWELADRARRTRFPTRTILAEPEPDGSPDGHQADLRSGDRPGPATTGTAGSAVVPWAGPATGGVDNTSSYLPYFVVVSKRPGDRRRFPRGYQVLIAAVVVGAIASAIGVPLGSVLGSVLTGRFWTERQAATPGGGTAAPAQIGPVRRSLALVRARSWHPHEPARIAYGQDSTHQGYRTDGSGYASMILGLPTPGPNSTSLATPDYTRSIPMADLRPGDLVINPVGDAGVRQVIVFDGWVDPGHTSYWAYQQRRRYGTDHLVLREGLAAGSPYHGFRPLNIRDDDPAGLHAV